MSALVPPSTAQLRSALFRVRGIQAMCCIAVCLATLNARAQEATVGAASSSAPESAAVPPAAAPAPTPPVAAPAPLAVAPPAPPAPLVVAHPAPPPPVYTAPVIQYQLPQPSWAPRPVNEAPSYVLPPLPAGYVYAPTNLSAPQANNAPGALHVAQAAHLQDELRRVDARLLTLRDDPVRLGGPIAMLVIGYGTTLIGAAVAVGSHAAAEDIEDGNAELSWGDENGDEHDFDFDDDGVVNGRDEELFRRTARVSTGVAAAGLVLGIVGTRRLIQRRGERRAQRQEQKELSLRRDSLLSQLSFDASYAPGQVGASVSGRY